MSATETASVTAFDVAVELVATKSAIFGFFEALCGTGPAVADSESERAADEWMRASPVPFPRDEEGCLTEPFAERLYSRAGEIELEMLDAASSYLARQAVRIRRCRDLDAAA